MMKGVGKVSCKAGEHQTLKFKQEETKHVG